MLECGDDRRRLRPVQETDCFCSFDPAAEYTETEITSYSPDCAGLVQLVYQEFKNMEKIRYLNRKIRQHKWGNYKDVEKNLESLRQDSKFPQELVSEFFGCIQVDGNAQLSIQGRAKLKRLRLRLDSELFVETMLLLGSKDNGETDLTVLEAIEQQSSKRNGYYYRQGVFVGDQVEIHDCLGMFSGHMVTWRELEARTEAKRFKLHSYHYFHPQLPLVLDTTQQSNMFRFIRRSCRPNVEIKAILHARRTPNKHALSVENAHFLFRFGLFATRPLDPGTELLLPLDYDSGNMFWTYFCACEALEFCLSPSPLESRREMPIVEHVEVWKESIRRGRKSKAQTSVPENENDKRQGNVQTPGLSREERKLQMYIDTIEKIETRERKRAERRHKRHLENQKRIEINHSV